MRERVKGEDGDLGGEKVLNMGRRVTRNQSGFPELLQGRAVFPPPGWHTGCGTGTVLG